MAVAGVEPRLDEGGAAVVLQQLQHPPFGIDEIDLPALGL